MVAVALHRSPAFRRQLDSITSDIDTGSTCDYGTTASNVYVITTTASSSTATTNIVSEPIQLVDRNFNVLTDGTTATNYYTQTGTGLYLVPSGDNLYNYTDWNLISFGPTPEQQRKQKLKQQHRVRRRLRGEPSFVDSLDPAEVRALQLLKSLVDAQNFRKYLKYGFVTVQGMSGLTYNIYRRRYTQVFDGQTKVGSLCVHLRGKQPHTDEVIAKLLMCEADEYSIWEKSNCNFINRTSKVLQLGLDKRNAA